MAIPSRTETILRFAGFDLDLAGPELRQDGRVISLRPKSLALISHLAQRPGQLVRKEDLIDAVWGETAVSDATLARTLFDAREALGDDSREPRFIETVHRLGFRFLGQPSASQVAAAAAAEAVVAPPSMFGRTAELERLEKLRAHAATGNRQVVFLSGDPGIGKTTLLDSFLGHARASGNGAARATVARGQSIEHYGTAEAYLPLLDVLADLCRGEAGAEAVKVVRRVAPTWLAQLPWLIEDSDRLELDRELRGVTAGRMMRELAQAIETFAADRLFVIALEDLHWCDSATADLLAFLARRQGPARLLVVATYRPVDAILSDNPIRAVHHELQRQGRCQTIELDPLVEEDVARLVARRFDAAPFAEELSHLVHRRTDGHPLFVVSMLEDLVSQGRISESDGAWQLGGRISEIEGSVPDGLLSMVAAHVGRLEAEERQVVEAASVVGATFSAAAAAAALERDLLETEAICETMAQRGVFLDRSGTATWPDGTSASAYTFRHALYGDALYRGIPTARRRRLHLRVAERLATAHSGDPAPVAAVLGRHYEEAGDHARAAHHLRVAAETASRRGAPREALALIARARTHLAALADGVEKTVESLLLELAAGPSLAALEGYTSPEVEKVFMRAREHCRALGDGPQLFPVLWGLWAFWCVCGRSNEALPMANQLLELAEKTGDRDMLIEARHALWVMHWWRGNIGECDRQIEAGLALYDRSMHHQHVMLYGQDPGIVGQAYRCLIRNAQGRDDEAEQSSIEAVELARHFGHHVSLMFAVGFMGWIHLELGNGASCIRLHEESHEIAQQNGLMFWLAHQDWIIGRSEASIDPASGLPRMRAAIAALRAMGACMGMPGYLAILVRTLIQTGDVDEAAALLNEAWDLGSENGEWLHRADVLRGRAEIELARDSEGAKARAEGFYREGLEIARMQEATRLELRVALDLVRSWDETSRAADIEAVVGPIVDRVPAGASFRELAEARAVLGR
jgi:DNA-binding winged helix-turn-helix (wHTH) protein/tetratricopeptide (TPR) repeat protein